MEGIKEMTDAANTHRSILEEKTFAKEACDPWKHRSARMKCRACMWFVVKAREGLQNTIGRCRRHSPTLNGYPVVFDDDWCGDHKLDENK